jgi:diguanylate cyclase (GGDEF)-like protein/PAS domain S-box-containing protein
MPAENDIYKDILDNLYDGVYLVDGRRRITYWNKGAERISGYPRQEVIGSSCADNLLMHVDDQGTSLCKNGCPLAKTLADGQNREAYVYLHHKNGHRVPVMLRVTPILDPDGQILGAVEVFSDNSSLLAALRRVSELKQEIDIDALTGVGNRRYIEARIQESLEGYRGRTHALGLLFIDVDFFKRVNDVYGHQVGDQVLKMVANTLRHSLRSTDALGRWGGDEFVGLVYDVDLEQLASIAGKLRALVASSSLDTERGIVRVTVSIGGTLARPPDSTGTLEDRADSLLYQSKTSGKNRVSFSD